MPKEIELELDELETRIDRLRALYEQYFMGIERLEPQIPRKDVERRIWVLRREQIRNTGLRFKFQMLVQRFNSFQQHWGRITREIENGTYKRDVLRAANRVGAREALTIVGRKRAARYASLLADATEEQAAHARAAAMTSDADDLPTQRPPPMKAPQLDAAKRPSPDATTALPSEAKAASAPEARASAPVDPALAKRRLTELAAGMKRRAAPAEAKGPSGPLDLDLDLDGGSSRGAAASAPPPSSRRAPASARKTNRPSRIPPRSARPAEVPGRAPPPRPPAVPPPGLLPREHASPREHVSPSTRTASADRHPPLPPPRPPVDVQAPRQASPPPRPVPPPVPSRPVIPPPTASSPRAAGDAIADTRLREIYSAYVETKRSVHESTAGITFDKLARSLRDQTEKLRAVHGAKSVDFEVVVKNGKTLIRPIMR